MTTSPTDISIVLSGGSSNTDPSLSLGGDPSNTPLSSGINNLFDDVTAEEQEEGFEDYRCFYLFNDGDAPIYSIKLWILEEEDGGGTIELGIRETTEIQRITINPTPTDGSMTLSYQDIELVSNQNADLATWAEEFENQLNSLVDNDGVRLLREVKVTASAVAGQFVFDIDFGGGLGGSGHDDKKNHDLIEYISDDFNNSAEVTIAILQEGGPVNAIAETIDSSLSPPNSVGFFQPSLNSPISIVRLLPNEGFAIWAKRVVPSDTVPVENDGFTFKFRSISLDPYA